MPYANNGKPTYHHLSIDNVVELLVAGFFGQYWLGDVVHETTRRHSNALVR